MAVQALASYSLIKIAVHKLLYLSERHNFHPKRSDLVKFGAN